MNQTKFYGALACGLLTLWSCSGHVVDPIGGGPSAGASADDTAGGVGGAAWAGAGKGGTPTVGSTAGAGNPAAGAGNPTAGTGAAPTFLLAGTWTGYVENYLFSDQADAVTLVLDDAGAGEVSFGSSPPPAPATDPDKGYPTEGLGQGGGSGAAVQQKGPVPGFTFTVKNESQAANRVQFDVAPNEVYTEWCELQTPIADETNPGQYSCIHNSASMFGTSCSLLDPVSMAWVPIDCTKFELCRIWTTCNCTADACTVATGSLVHFDLNLDGSKANGSITGLDGNVHNVHLTRN